MPDTAARDNKCQGGTEVEVFEAAMKFGLFYDVPDQPRDFKGKVNVCDQKGGDFTILGYERVPPYDIS